MTAWWKTTTRVRKVRARSSAALRAVALGAVRTSAFATDEEIEVMRAPAGDHLRCCRRAPDSARAQGPKSWFSRQDPAPQLSQAPFRPTVLRKGPPNSRFRSKGMNKTPPIYRLLPEPVPLLES